MDEPRDRPDVPYSGEHTDARRLDLFTPGANANGGAILWIHGGGWSAGNRQQWHACARHFRDLGYVCASAGYRLAPDTRWPGQIEDCRLAMAYLRGRAAELGFDPQRIAAAGSSAGGHLTAMLATDGPAHGETRPNAAICYCAVLTVHEGDRLSDAVHRLLGKPEADAPDLYREASPIDRVAGGEPPFLFLHGDADETVPPAQSRTMHAKLQAAGAASELIELPGVEHGFGYGVTTDAQEASVEHITRFLAGHFGL